MGSREIPGNRSKIGEYIPQGTREHGNREQKRGIYGELLCFLKNGELPANSGEPRSPGICNYVDIDVGDHQ